MSSINLFLLGFIIEKDWNAYELAKFLETHKLNSMIKISAPAIYKNLIKLAKKEYLKVNTVKESEMPEKKVYSITSKGKNYFHELMEKFATDKLKYHFDFNSFILNLDKIEKKERFILLDKLMEQLKGISEFYDLCLKEYHYIRLTGRAIMKQHKMLNETMIKWLSEFIELYRNEVNKQEE